MLTLQYIEDKLHHFKIYVANRFTQILESTSAANWNFILGVKNPVDICSRGVFNPNLLCKTDKDGRNWLSRPSFLHKSWQHWKIESIKCLDQNNAEIRQAETFVGVSTIKNGFINDKRYSSWQSIVRVMGWLERFYFTLMAKKDNKQCRNGKADSR